MLGRGPPTKTGGAARRFASPHISQIQTFVTDAALPAGTCQYLSQPRGIEVIEAMPKPSADLDEPGVEPPLDRHAPAIA